MTPDRGKPLVGEKGRELFIPAKAGRILAPPSTRQDRSADCLGLLIIASFVVAVGVIVWVAL